jgi:hypothetical protein
MIRLTLNKHESGNMFRLDAGAKHPGELAADNTCYFEALLRSKTFQNAGSSWCRAVSRPKKSAK